MIAADRYHQLATEIRPRVQQGEIVLCDRYVASSYVLQQMDGVPLPFISYGGSNLVACMFGIGLLLNVYRQGILEPPHKKPVAMRVRVTPRI